MLVVNGPLNLLFSEAGATLRVLPLEADSLAVNSSASVSYGCPGLPTGPHGASREPAACKSFGCGRPGRRAGFRNFLLTF